MINSMKIIFIPDYRRRNPYQKLLAEALSRHGAEVKFFDVTGIFALLRIILASKKTDVIHMHWIDALIPLGRNPLTTIVRCFIFAVSACLIRLLKIKIIWTVHNKFSHECKSHYAELFTRRVIAWLCHKMITHCGSVVPELASLYKVKKDKFEVILHGNYISVYQNTIGCGAARQKLQLKEKEFIFLFFGAVKIYKGYRELIDAFKKLNMPNTKLLFAGEPSGNEIRADVIKRCRNINNIKCILEDIKEDDIQIYMNASDIVVLPHQSILASGALILAMSFGKPVIASATGCTASILGDSGGILYDPSREDNLLKAMRDCINADIPAIGQYNFESAQKFGWDETGCQIYKLYQECL